MCKKKDDEEEVYMYRDKEKERRLFKQQLVYVQK